jgi:hypothetical protein
VACSSIGRVPALLSLDGIIALQLTAVGVLTVVLDSWQHPFVSENVNFYEGQASAMYWTILGVDVICIF